MTFALPRIGLIFGGPGPEHPISCLSAQAIWQHIDLKKYDPVAIGWASNGNFYTDKLEGLISNSSNPREARVNPSDENRVPLESLNLDATFPIVHGLGGEDGNLQGFLETLRIPYVGSGVQGCSQAWHKGTMKTLLKNKGIPVVPWFQLSRGVSFGNTLDKLQYPVFVKPSASGSSIGISYVEKEEEIFEALETAWVESEDVLIEPAIEAREFECALLQGQASPVGEIVCSKGFYSFEAKYLDPKAATPTIDPKISKDLEKKIQSMAVYAAKTLKVEKFCRVDFFLETKTNQLYINEINTAPGFTKISMYPQLWQKYGVSFDQLIDRLLAPCL